MTTTDLPRSRSFLHTLTPGPLALAMRAGVDPSGWLALAWGRRARSDRNGGGAAGADGHEARD